VKKRALVATLAPTAAAAVCALLVAPAHANGTQTLAQGRVKALPPGGSFLSIVDLRQPPGASLGPHGHVPGFVYVMSGEAIVENGSTVALNRGEGYFIPAFAAHTHKNSDSRLPAAALAVGLVIAVIVLLLVTRSPRARVVLLPVLLAALIAGGAVALWDPWKNDWFFIGVRPEAARGAPMPIPSASRTYESPEFAHVPPGPYVESLATTTVDPHGHMGVSKAPGPLVFLVLDGRADVTVGNEASVQLARHQATLVQAGESYRVLNPSATTLSLLSFALAPKTSSL
jgi:mannose-6-phosphate isomerase-like protein (cupin superfamily)